MKKLDTARIIWIVLGLEVAFGVFCLIANRAISSLVVIVVILGALGGLGFALRYAGIWASQYFEPGRNYVSGTGFPRTANVNAPATSFNIAGLNLNLSNYPERTETVQQSAELAEGISLIQVNVSSGGIKVTGQEGSNTVGISATRHVWARDEATARTELDRLQLRVWQEGNLLRIEAGDPDQTLVIGKGGRIDLEISLPPNFPLNLTASTGEISCQGYNGELNARTTFGNLNIENYNSGRNINLNTTSGKVSLQTVAAGLVRVRAGAGTLNLLGIGAEQLDLESTAGTIRSRGVNCGKLSAQATTGSVEVYQTQAEFGVELRTVAGRIMAEGVTTPGFKLEATSGTVFYRGATPTTPSEAISRVGSVQLVLTPGTGFNLEARSNVGTVETMLPVSLVTTQSRNLFEGQIGGGGAPLRASSQVGTVRVSQG